MKSLEIVGQVESTSQATQQTEPPERANASLCSLRGSGYRRVGYYRSSDSENAHAERTPSSESPVGSPNAPRRIKRRLDAARKLTTRFVPLALSSSSTWASEHRLKQSVSQQASSAHAMSMWRARVSPRSGLSVSPPFALRQTSSNA